MAKKEKKCECNPKKMGGMLLILGLLILLNAIYGWFSWGVFIGGLVAIKGLIILLVPGYPHWCK